MRYPPKTRWDISLCQPLAEGYSTRVSLSYAELLGGKLAEYLAHLEETVMLVQDSLPEGELTLGVIHCWEEDSFHLEDLLLILFKEGKLRIEAAEDFYLREILGKDFCQECKGLEGRHKMSCPTQSK